VFLSQRARVLKIGKITNSTSPASLKRLFNQEKSERDETDLFSRATIRDSGDPGPEFPNFMFADNSEVMAPGLN
jgi:hypothetical protein